MKKIITFLFLIISLFTLAQPGTLDTSFNPSSSGFQNGANGSIYATSINEYGEIFIGGAFTGYDGISRSRVAKLSEEGILDLNFNSGTGANNTIRSISIQSDGNLIVGGDFTSYDGVPKNRIARLASDGTLDTSFNPGTGTNGSVIVIFIQSDGKIVIGGDFTSYNGIARNRIARLNADGSLDTGFNPSVGANGNIKSISIQTDGKIIIVGDFTTYNSISRNRITRLNANGTLDTTFNTGLGANRYISSTSIQPDGKIIIGGDFNSYNGIALNRIARLNADGSLDITFSSISRANGAVKSTSIQSDGKIVIGGDFTSYNGISRKNIARLNTDGSLDTSFNVGEGPNSTLYTSITSILIQSDGKIIFGGDFTTFNNSSQNNITRLNADGSLDIGFNSGSGSNGYVFSTSIQSDSKIIIGGWFTTYNGSARNTIARINTDGSLDSGFNPGKGTDDVINSTSIQLDGKIIIGGVFTSYNGISRNNIARLNTNGSLDASFDSGSGTNSDISSVKIQTDSKLLIGGYFTTYNGIARNSIARLNTNGSLDADFNSSIGANGAINSIAIQSDGKIVIGGSFTTYNGITRNKIARLNADGSLDASFNPTTGANSYVESVSIQSDGKIILGGSFTTYNGVTRNRITRLNADGGLDTSFNPGIGANDDVYAISIQPDGKIIIGGVFTSYNGISRNNLARLNADGSLDTAFNPGTGPDSTVFTTSIQSDGKIVIGGAFTSYDGTVRSRVARINGGASLATTDFEKNDLKIYPNPIKDKFSITGNETINEIAIFDLLGKSVFTKKGRQQNIDISFLPKGIYILKVSSDKGVTIQKIIKE